MKQTYNIPTILNGRDLIISYHSDRFIEEVLLKGEYDFVQKYLKPNAIVLDLGCNIGTFSFYIYDKVAHIYAVDIVEECIHDLNQTIVDSALFKINTYLLGIGRNNEILPVNGNGESAGRGGFYLGSIQSNGVSTDATVEVLTLYTFLEKNHIDHIDLVKMDIEGSEYLLVEASDFSEACKRIDVIVGEFHNSKYNNLQTRLNENGFTYETFGIGGYSHFIAHR